MSKNQTNPISSIDENMKVNPLEDGNLTWYNPLIPPFRLSGFHWYDHDNSLNRLPLSSYADIEKVNPKVNLLSKNTAGGQLAFKTNSTSLSIRVKLASASNMCTMTASGQSGFDCYIKYGESPIYFEGVTAFEASKDEYEVTLFEKREPCDKEILLNFPLYNGVLSVELGLDATAIVSSPTKFDIEKPIVFYGTSITQGGCASRPGMAYTNIISRRLNANHLNLGFSGNAFGEIELAQVITQISDPSCIIIDFEANGGLNGMLEKNLVEFISHIRTVHTAIPILVVSRIPYKPESHSANATARRMELRDFQRQTVELFKDGGDTAIFFLDGSTMLGDDYDECYVDTIHPTDLGFSRMADKLTPIIKSMSTAD